MFSTNILFPAAAPLRNDFKSINYQSILAAVVSEFTKLKQDFDQLIQDYTELKPLEIMVQSFMAAQPDANLGLIMKDYEALKPLIAALQKFLAQQNTTSIVTAFNNAQEVIATANTDSVIVESIVPEVTSEVVSEPDVLQDLTVGYSNNTEIMPNFISLMIE